LDGLQAAAASPAFSVDATIDACSFLPSEMLQLRPPLISAAALFGAVDCCAWLAPRANVVQLDHRGRSPLQFAIAGGCDAVFSILERSAGLLTRHGLFQTAASFSQMGIYGWLLQQRKQEIDFDAELPDIFNHAIQANSITMIDRCLELGVDVNASDPHNGRFPLWYAVESGSVEAALKLLAHPDIRPYLERDRKTAMELAARDNQAEILRYFPARVIGDVFERSWDFAMGHGACASLRVLYDVDPVRFMAKLNRLIRETVNLALLDVITEDIVDLMCSLLEPRDRETLFVLALTTPKLLIVWALLQKEMSFTEPVRGRDGERDLPLFWAIEGGAECLRLFIGLAEQKGEPILPLVPNRHGKTIHQIALEQPGIRSDIARVYGPLLAPTASPR
jgi:hypothetical protein